MVNQTEKIHFPIWFKKLRLRKQILCIQLFSSLIILGILVLCLYLLFQFAQGKISDIAEQILIEKILLRFSNRIVKYYEIRVLQGFQDSSNQLTFMNQQYHFTLQNSLQFQYNVDEALLQNYTKFEPHIVWSSQFSFGIFGQQIYFQEQDLLQLSNILTQIQSLIPNKATLFFVGLRESQYFSAIPGNYFIDYIPKSRPWYQNHLNNCQSETFPLSEPYLNYFGGIIITQTGNLTNLRNEIIGICGNDINMTSFWGLNNIENVEIYLIDEKGRLILSPHYQIEQTEVDYIYDVNAIGFNKSDYLILTQQMSQTNQVCQFQLESFFCLENKKNNQIYYINTYPIKIYRVVIRFQKQQYENQLIKFEEIKQKVQNYNTQFEYVVLGVTLILFLIFQYLTSSMLQRPLERIMFCSKLVMQNNELPSMIRNFITKRRGDQIDKLSQAFQNLISLNRKRYISKKQTEYFTQQNSFPKNPIYYKYQITNYKKSISQLDNQGILQMQFTKSCLKFHNQKNIF